jgi:hypothetical protein
MDKIKALWALFHVGEEVADPAKWKSRQMTGTILGAVLVAVINLLKTFGYDIPLSAEDSTQVGAAIVVVWNLALTMVTSKRAGLPASAGAAGSGDSTGTQGLPPVPGSDDAPPTVGRVDNTLF